MYLAIDTSTKFGGVALYREGMIIRAHSWFTVHNHTAELMPAIRQLFEDQNLAVGEIKGIGVSQGPGGFSSIRAGLSVAKGLAYPSSIPVVGCSSLESAAYPYRGIGVPICSVTLLGRDLVGWANFGVTENVWSRLTPDRIATVPDFVLSVSRRHTVFCGDGVGMLDHLLNESMGKRARLMTHSCGLDRLQGLVALSSHRLDQGEADPIESLAPNYLRPPGITSPNFPQRVSF